MSDEADELKSEMFSPLWRFSKHPDDLVKFRFIDEIVAAGYTVVKKDRLHARDEPGDDAR